MNIGKCWGYLYISAELRRKKQSSNTNFPHKVYTNPRSNLNKYTTWYQMKFKTRTRLCGCVAFFLPYQFQSDNWACYCYWCIKLSHATPESSELSWAINPIIQTWQWPIFTVALQYQLQWLFLQYVMSNMSINNILRYNVIFHLTRLLRLLVNETNHLLLLS